MRRIKMDEKIKRAMMKLIKAELVASYTEEELKGFLTFEDLWQAEEVRNAYEESWADESETWRPYYIAIFKKMKGTK
jgi:hypothetical protein